MAVRYYCSGFNPQNAFFEELATRLKKDITNYDSIVYIPGGVKKIEKALNRYIPSFTEHFKKIGIEFKNNILITPEMEVEDAKKLIDQASFIMLMGGNPFEQKEICSKLSITENLSNYKGVMMGYSAGAMLMSEYIIVTPCNDEYPDFRIEEGLNLSGISIYPHNNFEGEEYPESINVGDETYQREDLITAASKVGDFYLLQDYINDKSNVSLIREESGELEFITEDEGKLFIASIDGIKVIKSEKIKR